MLAEIAANVKSSGDKITQAYVAAAVQKDVETSAIV